MCKEPLPKQFKLAKLLQTNNINRITRIKYYNPFKVMLQFESESELQNLINCTEFKEKQWTISKTMEVERTYGVIKNIELDCKDEEIMESLSSGTEIIAVKRLSRRNPDASGWIESETLRICFKGSSLPAYIYMYGVRINVEPYVYPVTQCSNCWKFGHYKKICPIKKIVCPKCSENHECCETTSYTCVNCKGGHMALSKACPVYEKEKKIRSIMSQFNCTYKKALTLYVPSSTPIPDKLPADTTNSVQLSVPQFEIDHTNSTPFHTTPLYSSVCAVNSKSTEVIQNTVDPVVPTTSFNKIKASKTQRKRHSKKINDISFDWECICSDSDCNTSKRESDENNEKSKDNQKDKTENKTRDLIEKIKSIILKQKYTIVEKIKMCLQILFQWFLKWILNKTLNLTGFNFSASDGE